MAFSLVRLDGETDEELARREAHVEAELAKQKRHAGEVPANLRHNRAGQPNLEAIYGKR